MDPFKLQAVREASVDWLSENFALGTFDPERQPEVLITPSLTVTQMQVGVSPDCSYRLVKAAIDAAQETIDFYIYNASADYLLDLLRQARDRGVKIRLMYDTTDTRGDERQKLAALDVDLKEAPSSDGRKVFTVCHQKFLVIDGQILLLESANWATSSIPMILVPGKFKKANREWLIRIDDPTLAAWFAALFQADWDIPVMPGPVGLGLEPVVRPESTMLPTLLANLPDQVFDIQTVALETPVTVTPVISPVNYFDVVKQQILAAKTSIDIEQQYILAGGPNIEGLLSALEQRKDEVAIRIIVSDAFRKVGAKDNWELSMDTLEAFNLKDRLRAMNLTYYTHLHNKGLIFDRQKVLVSSTNWSENSISRAREAGVLVESAEIAEYFAGVFDYDWSVAWDTKDVPENLVNLFMQAAFVPGAFEEEHPADMV